MEKVWLHTAAVAVVLVSTSAVMIPRLAARDAAQPASTSAVSSAAAKSVCVMVKVEFFKVSETAADDLQAKWHSRAAGANAYATTVLNAAEAKAVRASLLASGATIVNSPIVSTISGQRAEISVGSVIPYTVETRDGQGSVVSSEQRTTEVWSGFSIVPVVNADGSIAVDFHLINTPPGKSAMNVGPGSHDRITPGGAMVFAPAGDGSGNRMVIILTPSVVDKAPEQGSVTP